MRLQGFLSRVQVETIHHQALRVLSELGVRVEHEELRQRLEGLGARCDHAAEMVRFSPTLIERLIAAAPKRPINDEAPPQVSGRVGIYACRYLDAETNALLPFNEERLAFYIGLARTLKYVAGISMLGVPFVPEDIPAPYLPLAERLFAWKYGIAPGGSVLSTGLCESLLEMYAWRAQTTGKRLGEVFRAVGYLISPLRLARPECEQLLFFAQRGLHMSIGHLPSQGGTAPVTLAGAIVLALAEQLFLFLLQRALWEDASLSLGSDVSTIDMRTGALCYGRPEQQRINAAFADLARFYGCTCYGHTGNADAHLPGYEAAAQKATGALFTALATGHGSVSEGLLSVDEVCSPVQMVLDDDLVGSLKALLAEIRVGEEECAVEEILRVGPGGTYLSTDHTARRFRDELFQPRTWSAGLTSAWQATGGKVEVDRARDFVRDFARRFTPTPALTADDEEALRAIIARAIRQSTARC